MNRQDIVMALIGRSVGTANLAEMARQVNTAADMLMKPAPQTDTELVKRLLANNLDNINTADGGEKTLSIKLPGGGVIGLAIESEDLDTLLGIGQVTRKPT